MKNSLTILFFLTINFLAYSQSQKTIISTEIKTIQSTNGREVFNICKSNQNVTFNGDLEYFWYNDFSKIKSTKGGAGGNLLHGKYQFFDENGNLLIESNYYLGVKEGFEKTWDSIGNIETVYRFNTGKLIYSKFKNNDKKLFIEWNGPALQYGSIKKYIL